jgi:hypothetical protein
MSRTKQLTDQDERLVSTAEAELHQLLSIEPSPEFVVRVRSRVHANHDAPSRRWGWIGLALASTAAAALVVTAIVRTGETPGGSLERTEIARRGDVVLTPSTSVIYDPPAPPLSTASRVAIKRPSAPAASARGDAAPVIVIDPAMTAAIRRMAMSLRNSAPDPSVAETLHGDTAATAELAVPDPLMVPEIVLTPADQNGGDQNPFQRNEE